MQRQESAESINESIGAEPQALNQGVDAQEKTSAESPAI
jgi:hypothetical protein